ncbi:MAG: hypothetical protein B7Z15_23340 [Rhizobiales bacterium 32-66-8]|nr:MAG: hypothetical protein B7Z15_23340 [Rhizobiales bacterium 32-66-8]
MAPAFSARHDGTHLATGIVDTTIDSRVSVAQSDVAPTATMTINVEPGHPQLSQRRWSFG